MIDTQFDIWMFWNELMNLDDFEEQKGNLKFAIMAWNELMNLDEFEEQEVNFESWNFVLQSNLCWKPMLNKANPSELNSSLI